MELTPLRRYEHEVDEHQKVAILVPRFESEKIRKMFTLKRKETFVRFKLDVTGSAVWLAIDGDTTVFSISKTLQEKFGESFTQADERITKFLSELYFNKMISFKEIEG